MAADQLPDRPDRFEPRCRKRRPKPYPLMTQTGPVRSWLVARACQVFI